MSRWFLVFVAGCYPIVNVDESEGSLDEPVDTDPPPAGICEGVPSAPSILSPIVDTSPVADFTSVRPSVAFSASGVYAVAWTKVGSAPFAAFVRRYSDGVPLGAEVMVSPSDQSVTNAPAVAMNAAGELVVAWAENGGAVYLQRYDNLGTAVGSAVQVSPTGQYIITSPAVALSPTGDAIVAWTEAANFTTQLHMIDANGAFLLPTPVQASDPSHFVDTQPAVACAGDGAFAVAWTDAGTQFAPFVRRYDPTGSPVGAMLEPKPTGQFVTDAPALSMASDGQMVVSWTDVGLLFSVFAQPYDKDGTPRGAPVAANQTGFVSSPSNVIYDTPPPQSVSMACDASFVVAWTDLGTTFTPWLRRFGAGGVPLSDEEQILGVDFTDVTAWVAVQPDSGAHVVAWTDTGALYRVQHQLMER